MKLLSNVKSHFMNGIQNNTSLAVLSLIIAVIVWFAISMTQYPSVPKTIDGVKLSLDTAGTSVAENNLSVINCDVEKVHVKLKGSRTQIRSINEDTLEAYIDFENITAVGKKRLPIKVRSTSGMKYELESISPSYATVTLDKYSTIEMPVTARMPNLTFAEGKTPDDYKCEPQFVSITGPSSQIEMISGCYAYSDKVMENKNSSFTVNTDEIQLYTADGVEIDQSNMSFNTTNFTVTIEVLTQKKVTPKVSIMKVPSGFDEDCLNLKLSTDSLTIASKNVMGEIPDTLEIGKLSLSDIDLGKSYSFDISSILDTAGMINKSGIDTITVSLDDKGLARKEITLDSESIHLSNIPNDSYEYEVLTQMLTISVVGPSDIIKGLTAKDFVADASLLNVDTSSKRFDIEAVVSCITQDNVWSVTKVKVPVQKELKTEDED